MSESYKQIIRSSSIIGGASIINIAIGLVRMKLVALILGPSGVGLIGLLQTIVNAASTVSALGLGVVGTRQVAEAAATRDEKKLHAARRGLFLATIALSVLGGSLFWLFRSAIANYLVDNELSGTDIGWLALGVVLTVASGSQTALLNGLRRVRALALMGILSALISTAVGATAIQIYGREAIVVFVISAPLATFIAGHWFVSRERIANATVTTPAPRLRQFSALLRLGIPFMLSAVLGVASQLIVRAIVQKELGSNALGQFQAAATISMTYIAVVLAAMGNDYYPRLTAVIADRSSANRLVNEQTEVALLISAPIFLVMLAWTPMIIQVLYSPEFKESVAVLRLQIIGDVLKVCGWPLGYILLASGDGKTFLIVELISAALFVGISWIGISTFGIEATGFAFIVMYAALLPMVYLIARAKTGFKWWKRIIIQANTLLVAVASIFAIATFSNAWAAFVGSIIAATFGIYSFVQIGSMVQVNGPATKIVNAVLRFKQKLHRS